MNDSLKFLQTMQKITQLEINVLEDSSTFTDVWGRSSIIKLPKDYLNQLATAPLTPGVFLLAPNSEIRGALLVDDNHRLLIWQNLRSCTQQHLEQSSSVIWFGLNQQWPKIHKTYENELPLPEHILESHNSYNLEKQMLIAVRNGDDSSYQYFFRLLTSSGDFGQVAKDRLRNQKNLLICHITLLTRQAIEGGLSPSEAFALSDQLCQQVEALQTIEQLNAKMQSIGQLFIERLQNERQAQASQKSLLTQKIEAALREHCGQGYSLDDLANDLQRDKFYLAHLYKHETGQTINQYENSYRISRFKSRLLWTDQPITEIAASLGFATPNYASRCFKKFVGTSPQKYRQAHQLNFLHLQ
ncbi:helix-turn-helix domain-containing protein [Limosilactobacillus mucosae]